MSTAATNTNYPIQWSEGMLLSPQHFQQNDQYWEKFIHTKIHMVNPYGWGISHVKIDESELAAGTLSVVELDALMPDGLVINYRAKSSDVALRLPLKGLVSLEDGKGSLMAHVVVPIRAEAAASSTSSIQRFDSVSGGYASDENTGEGRVLINRLRPKISLSVEKPHPKYVSIPLCVIEVATDGAYRLGNYVPPLLQLSALNEMKDLCLQSKLRQVLVKIRKKANQLSGANSEKEDMLGAIISDQHAHIIRHMVSSLPALEIICSSGVTHPFDVYQALAQLIGQICSISQSSPVPPLLPAYRHDDIATGFIRALNIVDQIVNNISLSYSSVNFSEQEDGTFSISVDKTWLNHDIFIEVIFRRGQGRDEVLQWVEKSRVGSSSVLKFLMERRLQGALLENIKRHEKLGLTEKPNSLLFAVKNTVIETKDQKCHVIKPGQKLYIKGIAGTGAPLAIVLHVSNESPAS